MYTPGPQVPQEMQAVVQQAAPEPKAKPKNPTKSKGDTGVGSFIRQLIELSAYVHQLQVQSHLIHFNYEAPNFIGIHKFMGKQYEAHQDQYLLLI